MLRFKIISNIGGFRASGVAYYIFFGSEKTSKYAPAYNLAGQKVGKYYKGVAIKAGKKYIQK